MTVDLSVISVFNAKHKVYSPSLKDFFFNSEVPSAHRKDVQQVVGDLLFGHIAVHDVEQTPHPVLVVLAVDHEVSFDHHFLVQKLLLSCKRFEAFGNFVIAITDDADDKIVFAEVGLRILLKGIVVLKKPAKGILQFVLALVVHRYAHSHLGV